MKNPPPDLDEYLTPAEAADLLKLHPQTLARWRTDGTGPRFIKFGRHIRYAKKDLAAWAAANSHQSTAEISAA
jgi:excisionase family DNA binding protein